MRPTFWATTLLLLLSTMELSEFVKGFLGDGGGLSRVEMIREPLRVLFGNRADQFCVNCQYLECIFCVKDQL